MHRRLLTLGTQRKEVMDKRRTERSLILTEGPIGDDGGEDLTEKRMTGCRWSFAGGMRGHWDGNDW